VCFCDERCAIFKTAEDATTAATTAVEVTTTAATTVAVTRWSAPKDRYAAQRKRRLRAPRRRKKTWKRRARWRERTQGPSGDTEPPSRQLQLPFNQQEIAPQTEHRINLPADLRCDITMAGRGCAREVRRGLTARRRGCWRLAIKTTHLASKKPGRARVGYDSDRRPFNARNANGLRVPSSSCPWACAWACPSYCHHRRRLYRWHREGP